MIEDRLFRFAVVADTHVNPVDDADSTPWAINGLANGRAARVVDELAEQDLAFVVHLGDMVFPDPWDVDYFDAAVQRHTEIFGKLPVPLHVVAGNLDVGDKALAWSSGKTITEKYVSRFEEYFGATYYSFNYGACHFISLNISLLNSDLAGAAEHRRWLERDLANCTHRRIFMFTHYPVYLVEPHEVDHYDNTNEPARSWLLSLVRQYKVEAIFSGHVHNFFYDRYHDADLYILPSTANVRCDYSELARVAPTEGMVNGRNDADKLGYMVVDIYETDHSCRIVRTGGRSADAAVERTCAPASLRHGPVAPIGVDLAHRWTEIVDIPYMGFIDGFYRKRARNDYPLMALWELGIRRLRLPLADFEDPEVRKRIAVLGANGFAMEPFIYGVPASNACDVFGELREFVKHVEVILPASVEDHESALREFREQLQRPVYVSKLRPLGGPTTRRGVRIDYGLNTSDIMHESLPLEVGDGHVVRVGPDEDIVTAVTAIGNLSRAAKLNFIVQVAHTALSPADHPSAKSDATRRIAETMMVAKAYPECHLVLDSFLEQDRGVAPRDGLIDRRFNLTPAGHVVRNLTALLAATDGAQLEPIGEVERDRICMLREEHLSHLLVPNPHRGLEGLEIGKHLPAPLGSRARVADLTRDTIRMVEWSADGDEITLAGHLPASGLLLITFTAL